MTPSGDLEMRLRDNIRQERYYEIISPPGAAHVVELEEQGKADVECTVPEGALCIQWNLRKGMFGFLKQEKNADGALFLAFADGTIEAHVMECKETVNMEHWGKAKVQMRWTLTRLLALAGLLGVRLSRTVLYTAYRTDKLSPDSYRNPARVKVAILPRATAPDDDVVSEDAGREELDWDEDEVRLREFDGSFRHRKVVLDPETGAGIVALSPE